MVSFNRDLDIAYASSVFWPRCGLLYHASALDLGLAFLMLLVLVSPRVAAAVALWPVLLPGWIKPKIQAGDP